MNRTHTDIAILSEQTLWRDAMSTLLGAHGFHRVADYATAGSLLAAARLHAPDVLLIDLDNEHEDTLTVLHRVRRELPSTYIVVVGSALRLGAADTAYDASAETPGVDLAALIAAAKRDRRARRRSHEATRYLHLWDRITPRQRIVLQWLATGADNPTIASKLRVGERAVKAHISNLLEMFALDNRTKLALVAQRAGLSPPGRAAGETRSPVGCGPPSSSSSRAVPSSCSGRRRSLIAYGLALGHGHRHLRPAHGASVGPTRWPA